MPIFLYHQLQSWSKTTTLNYLYLNSFSSDSVRGANPDRTRKEERSSRNNPCLLLRHIPPLCHWFCLLCYHSCSALQEILQTRRRETGPGKAEQCGNHPPHEPASLHHLRMHFYFDGLSSRYLLVRHQLHLLSHPDCNPQPSLHRDTKCCHTETRNSDVGGENKEVGDD